MIDENVARVRGDIAAAAQKKREKDMFWAKLGINVAGAIASIYAGPGAMAAANGIANSLGEEEGGGSDTQSNAADGAPVMVDEDAMAAASGMA